MPSVYLLKPAFQRLLRPLVRWLAEAGVTANQVTVAALLLSVATCMETRPIPARAITTVMVW